MVWVAKVQRDNQGENPNDIDAARLTLALNELRLPAIKALWPRFAEQADKEGWRAARLLSALVEHEPAERDRRRVERHIVQARLLPGKTLDTFDFTAVPMLSKAHINAITAGDSWVGKGGSVANFWTSRRADDFAEHVERKEHVG